jgi:hypothetical protein
MVISSINYDDEDDEAVQCWWFSNRKQFIDDEKEADEGFMVKGFPECVLEVVASGKPKNKPKLLVTERDSDLESAKQELEKYLSAENKKNKKER